MFAFAQAIAERPRLLLAGLAAWAVVEELAVIAGLPQAPGATLIFGLAGALAVVAAAVGLATAGAMRWLAYCGRHSLAIYLSFFLPMAAARIALIKLGWIADVGALSLAVTAFAVVAPLAIERASRATPLAFLYARPNWARRSRPRRQPWRSLALAD